MEHDNEKDPCLTCGCYDQDMGCTMPSVDKLYACSREQSIPTEFFLSIIPPTVTHQEKKVKVVYKDGKPVPVFYEPAELKAARSKLMAYLGKHVPADKYTTAVRLITKWCFPITGKHKSGEYKTSKPDTDNLQKLLKDVMTSLGYWKDDALVASEIIEKFWAVTPGIYIRIEELE